MRTEFRSESPKGRDKLKDKKCKCDDNIKMGMVWKGTASEQESAVGFCEFGKEPLGFLKIEEVHNQLDHYRDLKEDFILGSLTMKWQCH